MATPAWGLPPTAAAAAPSMPIAGDAARARAAPGRGGRVAAGDVAELVGDHRAQLVDAVELGQQAGVDEDVLPAGDEGVRLAVVDDVEVHAWPG